MTDRVNSFIVYLDKPYRDDDVVPIQQALEMTKHVIRVEPVINDLVAADAAHVRALSGAQHDLAALLSRWWGGDIGNLTRKD